MPRVLSVILAVVLAAAAPATGAALTSREVLRKAQAAYQGVRDYTARVTLTTDIPGLELPVRNFTVYVKRPDLVKVESDHLVVVPKDVLLFGNLEGELARSGRVSLAGVGREGSQRIYCLKIRPEQAAQRERALLWVEGEHWTLVRSEVWSGGNRLLTVYWKHLKVNGKFWLPGEVSCDVSGGALGGSKPGHLTVTFSDYRVNSGLSDDLFRANGGASSTR